MYLSREGLVNLESHSDFFSPMHPTIRIYDNRIEFQNPGRFIRGLEHLRDTIQSMPRNPTILKLFRYAKLSENAGYGIDKIYSWERLTGEKVEISTDVMSSTVIYWRPKVGTSIHRGEKTDGAKGGTPPKTSPNPRPERGPKIRDNIIRIINATPTITKAELASLLNLTEDGVRYHIRILKKDTGLHWEGASKNGHWVIPKQHD